MRATVGGVLPRSSERAGDQTRAAACGQPASRGDPQPCPFSQREKGTRTFRPAHQKPLVRVPAETHRGDTRASRAAIGGQRCDYASHGPNWSNPLIGSGHSVGLRRGRTHCPIGPVRGCVRWRIDALPEKAASPPHSLSVLAIRPAVAELRSARSSSRPNLSPATYRRKAPSCVSRSTSASNCKSCSPRPATGRRCPTPISAPACSTLSALRGLHGFALGVLNDQQMDRLTALAAPYLNSWRFQLVRHPMTNSEIWVPIGLPLTEEMTATGLTFVNRPLRGPF